MYLRRLAFMYTLIHFVDENEERELDLDVLEEELKLQEFELGLFAEY